MIGIIDYKAGNAPSVLHAVAHLGYDAVFVKEPKDFSGITHIILPGVGSAGATMKSLNEMQIKQTLEQKVLGQQILFLGICVGMQILFEHSQEGDVECFGWLKGNVVKFDATAVRVPQMGWNKVNFVKDTPCVNVEAAGENFFYFVNSYYAVPADRTDVWGESEHDGMFASAVNRNNIYATQFHIEKSGEAGLKLLDRFLQLRREENNDS